MIDDILFPSVGHECNLHWDASDEIPAECLRSDRGAVDDLRALLDMASGVSCG
jgi:hypothetical protein